MHTRLRQALPVLIGLVLFTVALEVLRTELRAVSWHELTVDIVHTSPGRLGLALFLTILNYVVLTGYDFLAFQYIGKRLQAARIALASFLAYAIANNVGFAMLSGTSIRYRFYTRWGVTNEELSRIVFSYSVTFWLGLAALGGFTLAASDLPSAHELPAHGLVVLVGWMLMVASTAYIVATLVRQAPIRVRNFEFPLPPPRIAVAQLAVSVIDWTLASAVLYVLLPPSGISFPGLLGAFMAAQLLGLASHVPGGVGVFEGLMVLLLKPFLGSGQLLPALVVYRVVYYLLPLTVALVVLVADEVRQRKDQAARVSSALGQLTEQLAPRTLAIFTFLAGLVLLLSGATPAAAGRLALLDRLFPLGVIEVSHFAGSAVGAVLLVLSQGIARRVDAAYFFTLGAIGVGMTASLLKGADYEEAALLALLLLVLWRARPAFDRRAAFFETRFSVGWTAAVLAAVIASIWLGFFAFKHVEFSNELWWQFELYGEASRFMRASIGASIVLFMFGFARLIGYAPHETVAPDDAAFAAVAPVIESQTSTFPYLVYLGDKTVLFDDDKKGFVMYGVQGRTWVALGDPIAPPERLNDLIRLFIERCDDFGGVPVFYQVCKEHLHRYADFGMTFVKLGEEAKVDLNKFTLDGSHASKYRQAVHRLEKDRATFRVVSKEGVPAIMEQLRSVSDDWLKEKRGAEKGFSLGFFESRYLSRFPVAVIERDGHIQAFANLWPGPEHVELSIDLMRYHHEAPRDVMEALFVHLMKWGKEQGYQWFALGMAPLSGFDRSPVAPLWNRLGSFLYEHGESIYHFQGLRAYKDKFKPAWEPRYLAYPGGFKLPRVLADVSAVVAGGYRKIFVK